MQINTYGSSQNAVTDSATSTANNTILGKDDFMKLLLVQLQYQDPTSPMDAEKILTQTSQLASLESSNNTKDALTKLTQAMGSTNQFSTIAAIGKTADLGSDSITHTKDSSSSFEVYFPQAIKQGTISITDKEGAIVDTLDVGTNPAGVYQFTWDGEDPGGSAISGGIYHINANYTDANGKAQTTRLGAYPIESVKFDKGQTLVKLGSNYVPLANIKEVY